MTPYRLKEILHRHEHERRALKLKQEMDLGLYLSASNPIARAMAEGALGKARVRRARRVWRELDPSKPHPWEKWL